MSPWSRRRSSGRVRPPHSVLQLASQTGAPDAARPGALMTEVLGVSVSEGAGPSPIAESLVRAASRSPRCPRWRPWRDSSPSRTADRRPLSLWRLPSVPLLHTLLSWRRCTAGRPASRHFTATQRGLRAPRAVRRGSAVSTPSAPAQAQARVSGTIFKESRLRFWPRRHQMLAPCVQRPHWGPSVSLLSKHSW